MLGGRAGFVSEKGLRIRVEHSESLTGFQGLGFRVEGSPQVDRIWNAPSTL